MSAKVADEIAALELLAFMAEDFDDAAKAKRLRAKARKLAKQAVEGSR